MSIEGKMRCKGEGGGAYREYDEGVLPNVQATGIRHEVESEAQSKADGECYICTHNIGTA